MAEWLAETLEEVTVNSAQNYLIALRNHHVEHHYSVQVFNDERLKRILRGAKRKFGIKPIRTRMDITKDILQKIVSQLTDDHDDLNIKAAFCTAFAAFFRLADFTWQQWSEQSHITNISRGSVQFTTNGNVILHLPVSKTDQFRQGVSIPLSASNDSTCPVAALRSLLHRYPAPPTAPLFSRKLGSFNRLWVTKRLDSLLLASRINPAGFSGHSFRRGAANTAFSAGIDRSDIMKMGRWKSDAVDRYISSPTNTTSLFALSARLHTHPGPSTPTPERRRFAPPVHESIDHSRSRNRHRRNHDHLIDSRGRS